MTEDQAKEKWCPFVVASHTDPRGRAGYSREEIGLPADTFTHACIGSACMAWRWRRGGRHPGDAGASVDPRGFWHRDGQPLGYCGLAGEPR